MSALIGKRSAALVGLLAIVGLGCFATRTCADPPDFLQKPSPRYLRLLCYNVNWDSIFPDGDPSNHPWRAYDMSEEFTRILSAVDPDIVCLQEINPDRDPQDVADILDSVLPLGAGEHWRAHAGSDNVIAARFDLSMLRTDTDPSTFRGQAMALVELPDETYGDDLYLINPHFKAGGGASNIDRRQRHADANIRWIADIQSPGGQIDLPDGTPIVLAGDLNVYDTDPHYHLTTLITGDIVNESLYGPDNKPDWDQTDATDLLPLHNGVGPDFYTWRDDRSSFNPGDLDHIVYADSALCVGNALVLNTVTMSSTGLAGAGLQIADVVLDLDTGYYDHLPLVADLWIDGPVNGDWNASGSIDAADVGPLVACLAGPGATVTDTACVPCRKVFDFDSDADLDAYDFAEFQARYPADASD